MYIDKIQCKYEHVKLVLILSIHENDKIYIRENSKPIKPKTKTIEFVCVCVCEFEHIKLVCLTQDLNTNTN